MSKIKSKGSKNKEKDIENNNNKLESNNSSSRIRKCRINRHNKSNKDKILMSRNIKIKI
jgi:hypothetical protein